MPLQVARARRGMPRRWVKKRPTLKVINEPLPLLAAGDIVRRDPDRKISVEAERAQVEEHMVKRAERESVVRVVWSAQ